MGVIGGLILSAFKDTHFLGVFIPTTLAFLAAAAFGLQRGKFKRVKTRALREKAAEEAFLLIQRKIEPPSRKS